ncbi:MAG: hypothetical protein NTZ01_06575 [Verrucomicrobia bacterium]|nr:hypothetical protein [Verrucomicrobiota bacterium]
METEGPIKRRVTGNSATLTLPSHEESCVVYPIGNEEVVRNAMQENRATILNQFVFGNNKRDLSVRSQRQHCKVPSYWLYRDDAAGTQADICSAQLFAVSGVATHPVIVDNHHIGFSYEDENAFHCRLGGVLSSDVHASRTQQTLSVMKRLEQALMQCGMQFSDIVRTWFYLDELLDWYDEFNVARTGFFRDSSILDRVLPASTGIGLANTAGYALCAGLIAIRPKNRKIQIQEISSPMQCSACTYRSSFSRAVEVEFPTHRSLYISGTASIDSEGGLFIAGMPCGRLNRR